MKIEFGLREKTCGKFIFGQFLKNHRQINLNKNSSQGKSTKIVREQIGWDFYDFYMKVYEFHVRDFDALFHLFTFPYPHSFPTSFYLFHLYLKGLLSCHT